MSQDSVYSTIFNEVIRPIEDLVSLFVNVFWGTESTIEDVILMVGTFVAFVAFILWCCFPVVPRDMPKPVLQVQDNNLYKDYCNEEEKYNQIGYDSNNT